MPRKSMEEVESIFAQSLVTLEEEMQEKYAPPKPLDELFTYHPKYLTAFYGDTEVGKTHLAVYIPILVIIKNDYYDESTKKARIPQNVKFIIVDTENGVRLPRLLRILKLNGISNAEEVVKNNVVKLVPPNFNAQHQILLNLDRYITANNWEVVFVALDSAVALTRPEQQEDIRFKLQVLQPVFGKIARQLIKLTNIARDYNAIVTYTSWIRSSVGASLGASEVEKILAKVGKSIKNIQGAEEQVEKIIQSLLDHLGREDIDMVGGRDLQYFAKTVVKLIIPRGFRETTVRKAILVKSRERPVGKSVFFRITDEGIGEFKPENR